MPLVTAAVLLYAAGLLAGFGKAPSIAVGVALLVVALGVRGNRERFALIALGVAGAGAASASDRAERDCRAWLRTAGSWRAIALADIQPAAFARVRSECGAVVRLSVAEGSAEAGALVEVMARADSGRFGLLAEQARVRRVQRPDALARWRATVARGIDARFGVHAPLVRALLIADMGELSPAVRERFSAAGLSHMLSVSGLHVGLIAVAVLLVAQIARLGKRSGHVVVVALTTLYVAAIGAPLPAVRSAVMLSVMALSTTLQRPTSPWAVLAVGAGVPLVDPRAVLDLGYQLSIVGMVALVASGALVDRWTLLSAPGWKGSLLRGLVASVAATALTSPLVAATFGTISLVAPLTNLVGVPVMAVLQPMLFLAALMFPLGDAGRFVADACFPFLAAIDALAMRAAVLPGAAITVQTDFVALLLACACAAALVVAAVSRFPGRALVLAAACITALAWRPVIAGRSEGPELHVIDVGQGDAIAVRSSKGRWVLFDAGRTWNNGDEARRTVVPYITARGGQLWAFVLSHPHADHVGGAATAVRTLAPIWFYDPGYAGGSAPYRESLQAVQETRSRWRRVRPFDSLVVDDVTVTFLAPDSAWVEGQRDPNLASTVAHVRAGGLTALLTGDAEAEEEEWLLAHARQRLGADVLKVGHHGSSTSSTYEFLDAVQARLAVISVGAENRYGHPSPDVLRSLARLGATTLRTDHHGSIVVRGRGQLLEIETGRERWLIRR